MTLAAGCSLFEEPDVDPRSWPYFLVRMIIEILWWPKLEETLTVKFKLKVKNLSICFSLLEALFNFFSLLITTR